ncbi:MAG: hypothetical protein DLM50_01120 [Candidatus Meridianibacter frigidus]|nr:MAG: hypothetical protein DLM50_01120 [Candidatus Eremiobacteraeota bacterium]
MMMRAVGHLGIVLYAAALCACSGGGDAARSGEITVAGSTAILPLVKQAAQDYQAAHPEIKISVAGGGSRVGLTQAEQKGVDIGDSDIPPASGQSGLLDHRIAIVTFAVIGNPANGVNNLSGQLIRDIFSGKISNWEQAGGKDQKVTIINRPSSSGTRAVFVSKVLDGAQPSATGLAQDSSGTVITTVAQTPGAVSYVATGYLKSGRVVPISIDGLAGSSQNVRANRYKFWSYEHMVTPGKPPKAVGDFIAFVTADKGLLIQLGFIPTTEAKPK